MSHGLFWFSLLAVFLTLARLGWVEYRKLEYYRHWAKEFEHSKYDILAVLGQRGDRLVWGKPTRQGIIQLQSCGLEEITAISVMAGGQPLDNDTPDTQKSSGRIELVLQSCAGVAYRIPFTELPLALAWRDRLRQMGETLRVE
ncbi:hypothetical protein L5470_01915 [Synechococcus sp. PCC 6717]|jgi:hypothetical protein|uniref:Uncharacterized protein n=1 Tax=Parathermosynechococcus lividus PCC 6715 TaxID=1917166 RepID=A0A2D2Q151_PARLV|nr:hypothetical protein [Thermostichus lividus]ATS18189.1 hypothetical protein BRW62_04830 [Thermostichus lividus PCC 6715]MCI3279749.1 hypothetical protein [Synechococcus sp. PCC 6717]